MIVGWNGLLKLDDRWRSIRVTVTKRDFPLVLYGLLRMALGDLAAKSSPTSPSVTVLNLDTHILFSESKLIWKTFPWISAIYCIMQKKRAPSWLTVIYCTITSRHVVHSVWISRSIHSFFLKHFSHPVIVFTVYRTPYLCNKWKSLQCVDKCEGV